MSSRAGSTKQSAEVRRAAVITHGKRETTGAALEQLQALAEERGVELIYPEEEAEKHGLFTSEAEARREETLGGADGDGGWRVAEGDRARYPPDQFWLPTPAFYWGD